MSELLSPIDMAAMMATAPASPGVRLGRRTLAGADLLAMRSAQGIERQVMPHLARTGFQAIQGTGANTLAYLGLVTAQITIGGTASARAPASTSRATRAKRTGFVSTATAGTFASVYQASAPSLTLGDGSGNGGFFYCARFVPSDAATVSGARMFVGLSSATGAPTNVEPSGLTNQIGVTQLSGSTNLQIVFGGSAAQAAIDFGSNFPVQAGSTDLYELILFSDPLDNTKVGYRVERLNTGNVAEGTLANTTPGTTLPAATTMLGFRNWRTNNATALAVGLDLVIVSATADF